MKEQTFESFGIVELMGHAVVVGKISEQTIGGESFIRVDVFRKDADDFTKLYGKGAIYAMTLTDEETAREYAKHHDAGPAIPWSMRTEIDRLARSLPAPNDDGDDQDDDGVMF